MTTATGDSDTILALDGIVTVSRETEQRLEQYVALLKRWQVAENLVASSTLSSVWRRHIADSAQLVKFFPSVRTWLDLGSGAGFPGLVTAILLAEQLPACVHLVESNARKCAFLRQVIRDTDAPARVHHGRIESVLSAWTEPVEMISARGLAPLNRLFSLAEPVFDAGASAAFHKGQDFEGEIAETAKSWELDLIPYKSLTDPSGVILEIRQLTRKAPRSTGSRGRL